MKKNKIFDIYEVLSQTYGLQGWWPLIGHDGVNESKEGNTLGYHVGAYDFPQNELQKFEICLGAFLTQNTTFTSVVTSLHNLKDVSALSPDGIKRLDMEVFKQAIKPSGYFNQKAMYILGFIEFFNALEGSTPTREALLGVKGVGEETADSILLYAYNQEEFIVDAYTKRILLSLGLIPQKASYKEVKSLMQEALKKHVPKHSRVVVYQEYHALIVNHAKTHYSRKPYAAECLLHKCQ